jgi:hypothetical protein
MEANSKDLVEFARLALRFRLLAPPSIVAWADALIPDRDIPEPWLIDLALAKPDTIDDSLRRVPCDAQGDLPMRLFLALLHRRWHSGTLTIGDVRGIGWLLHCERALPAEAGQADWGVCLEVEGEELDAGWRTEDDLRASIDEKLAEYFGLEAWLPAWARPA